MTARQARKARRAAERKVSKLEKNHSALSAKAARQDEAALLSEPKTQLDEAALLSEPKTQLDEAALLSEPKSQGNVPAEPKTRKAHSEPEALAPSDRALPESKTQKTGQSTGPRTQDGKDTSRWNSFKHGLYAKQLVLPGEDPAELDALRATLRAEHQPATAIEEILVNEIAEQFWRLRRMREFEARGMQPENFDYWFEHGLLTLVARQMASAERGMHKAITALRRLQLDRGFVPSKTERSEASTEIGFVSQKDPAADEAALLSEPKTQLDEAALLSEPKTQVKFVPEDAPEVEFVPPFFAEDLAESVFEIPDHRPFSSPSLETAA